MLSGPEILRQIELGAISIDPLLPGNVGPNSVDLCLGPRLMVYEAQLAYVNRQGYSHACEDLVRGKINYPEQMVLDARKANTTADLVIPERGLVMVPGVLYLGCTVEFTAATSFVPRIDGRSSMGRLGVGVHLTAGLGDTGFGVPVAARWTLEIFCLSPVRIYPGDRICQIYFEPLQGDYKPYTGKYQGAQGAQASMKHLDT